MDISRREMPILSQVALVEKKIPRKEGGKKVEITLPFVPAVHKIARH